MPIYRLKYVQEKFPDLHKVIPDLVNRMGQHRAAQQLGLSASTVNKWLKDNGYQKRLIYVRDEETSGVG